VTIALEFLELHELDQLLVAASDPECSSRWRRMGYAIASPVPLVREREKLAERLDRRWLSLYERSLGRYGSGLSAVRQRVCLGCRLRLPTASAPSPGEAHLHLCEGCGRLLLWD